MSESRTHVRILASDGAARVIRSELTRRGLTVKVSHRDGSAVVIGQSP